MHCRATLCPQRGAISVNDVSVRSMMETFTGVLFSVVPPYNIINIDAPSTGRSAQWDGVAGCSDWLQSEGYLENN